MSLAEKVENAYIGLIENKVTLAANSLLGGSLYMLFEGNQSPVRLVAAYVSIGLGVVALGTKCGTGTVQFYCRTEQHIQKYGRLKPRVVELWITHKTENLSNFGYCQLQGIYLAAKKYDQLDAFYEAKNKVSKVKIPNF